MKEIVKIVTQETTGYVVVVTGLTEELTADNVLGIINETQQKVLYTPVSRSNMQSAVYSDGTLTITLSQSVPEIAVGNKLFIKLYVDGDPSEDATAVARFFNLPESLPSGYHAMTTEEVLEIADEEWLAMYGFVAVPNTLHTVNPLGQQVEIVTYFKPSRTYGDYGFPELWALNDQQQWVSILNDYPTADRDIYTYNPSNNE